ncbi:MAG: CerR family C-terminal domain-containing protein [Verrucomicrobia bacterium]|nr:CerR family C-terminal domain-containing protein [Verrucomicrobiota bacterium]
MAGKLKSKPGAAPAETRQLLLEAAGAVFAEHGYYDTTVRQICQRAGVNVAAINYHFGDKQRLYTEVLRDCQAKALAKYPPDLGLAPGARPVERLRAFVRSFLFRIFDAGPTAYHGKLLTMEMINPTPALDAIVNERFRPMAEQLSAILRELLGKGASAELVRLCVGSVVSQCVFYHHCRPAMCRLYPDLKFGPAEIERLADHITRFSLAGLNDVAKRYKGRR